MPYADAIKALKRGFSDIGYRAGAIVADYDFATISEDTASSKSVPLAVFTDTPTSYRNAAFGILLSSSDATATISECRDLGAPYWLHVFDHQVDLFQLQRAQPIKVESCGLDELQRLFRQRRKEWKPESLQRAKLAAHPVERETQLALDIALVNEIEARVSRVLGSVISDVLRFMSSTPAESPTNATVLAFAMIASKILIDRGHAEASRWDVTDVNSVLKGISSYYGMQIDLPHDAGEAASIRSAWAYFRPSLNLRNISAEDLAYVYENTLVTREVRKNYGTHSTPRPVAEFLVAQLRLESMPVDSMKLYEPFCGASSLLLAASRQVRAMLPLHWSDAKRHQFMVSRIGGADIDQFATQVSTLSLILADYPNRNGWKIATLDLFKEDWLTSVPKGAIVLCNPPFEDFTQAERDAEAAQPTVSVRKPVAALEAILDTEPKAIAWVMPSALISDVQYQPLRQRLASTFDEIQVVSLPDRVFKVSQIESALVIARRDRADRKSGLVRLRSITIKDQDRARFLERGETPPARAETVNRDAIASGMIWRSELQKLWDYLARNPKFGCWVDLHRGLEWKSGLQAIASQSGARTVKGFHQARRQLSQFEAPSTVNLNVSREELRGNAIDLPWSSDKVLMNAIRASRGPWRVAAWADRQGRTASQQFIAAWPKDQAPSLEVLAAFLNSPLTSAFLFERNSRKGIRLADLADLPMPFRLDATKIEALVHTHQALLKRWHSLPFKDAGQELAITRALMSVDAAILEAYDLPPALERRLLDLFNGEQRPAIAGNREYFRADFKPYIALRHYLNGWETRVKSDWLKTLLESVPKDEGEKLGRLF